MRLSSVHIRAIVLFLLFAAGFSGLADYMVNTVAYKWDQKTDKHLDQLLINAGAAYGVSRGLNAIISVIQESDINVIIGNLALGEALDPVNDIVERFSNVMLVSITSIGIQKFIYQAGKYLGVNLFLTLALLSLFTSSFIQCFPILKGEKAIAVSATLGTTFLTIFFLARFIIPLITLVSIQSANFFEKDINTLINELEEIKDSSRLEYSQLSSEFEYSEETTEQNGDKGLLSRITDSVKNTGKQISDTFNIENLKANIVKVTDSLKESIQHILDLIVLFIIQTIVVPILTLLLLKGACMPLLKLFFNRFSKSFRDNYQEIRS